MEATEESLHTIGDEDLEVVPFPKRLSRADAVDPRSEAEVMQAKHHSETEILLHVYDLGPLTGRLNEFVLRGVNLGAFHCGIEVLGDEWSFQGFHDAWDDPSLSGVVRNEPRLHTSYIYRETISLGESELSEEEIDNVIDDMMDAWAANGYHLVARNCVTFAEEFAAKLKCPEPFPAWVGGAAAAGQSPAVFAVADYGWSWFKWWSKRQAAQEALALEEAEATQALEYAEAAAAASATTPSARGEGIDHDSLVETTSIKQPKWFCS